MDARIKQYLDKKTREEKQQKLVDQVESWDLESMIDWIKCELETRYEALSDDDLDEEYYLANDYEIECELNGDDDEYYLNKEDENGQDGCQCPNLFLDGHLNGCPEKRS